MWGKLLTNCRGMTLLEVLAALIILSILLLVGLRLGPYLWQIHKDLKEFSELEYALSTGSQAISKAIRSAQTVEWLNEGKLRVKAGPIYPEQIISDQEKDLYYISDKDGNGITDLYREHLSQPNPIVSRISELVCIEVEPGLWQVKLTGQWGKKKLVWQTLIRQRNIPF